MKEVKKGNKRGVKESQKTVKIEATKTIGGFKTGKIYNVGVILSKELVELGRAKMSDGTPSEPEKVPVKK